MGDELEISITGLGAMFALFFLTASLFSPAAGRLVQRVGWRPALIVNAIASSSILLAIALFARSAVSLGILLVAAAFIYSGSNPASNLTLSQYVDPTRRALIFGLKHAGIPFSTLLAGFAVPVFVVTVGWRWAYAAAALLGIVVLLLIPSETAGPHSAVRADDGASRPSALSTKGLLGFAAGTALATWAAVALSTYLVAASVEVGFSESAAGLLLFGGSAASVAVRITAGHLTDRSGGRGFGGMILLTGLGTGVFLLLPMASGFAFALLVLAAFGTGWAWPGLMTYSVINANPDSVAASSAIAQAGVFLGAGGGPLVLGWAAETWSFDAVWIASAAALAVATLIVGLVANRTAPARLP